MQQSLPEKYSSIMRLTYHLKKAIEDNDIEPITVFIGAGCSLSSTKEDISTYGIIKSICEKHFEVDNDNWKELYEDFVNNIWSNQGELDRINLLKSYFNDCTPSKGYIYLRKLIDLGCIGNIITTNFDLLINDILDGLSYKLQIGESVKLIGNNPKFTVIKAHGDLEEGQLRFAPSELMNLPNKISDEVNKLSKSITVVIGYRGQDNGILQALNTSKDHCAFWVSPTKPDIENSFENTPLYNWMKSRNSINNFIFDKYGDFNLLMEFLYNNLVNNNSLKKQENIIWKDTYISNCFKFNNRITSLFIKLNEIMDIISLKRNWKVSSPYYAISLKKLMINTNKILNDTAYKKDLEKLITNEIEALIFAITIEIYLRCADNIQSINEYLFDLVNRYTNLKSEISISNTFWKIIANLLNDKMAINFLNGESLISFIFDDNKQFLLSLEKPNLQNLYKLFYNLKISLLFSETAEPSQEPLKNLKKLLETKFHYMVNENDKLTIYLTPISFRDYRNFEKHFFYNFSKNVIADRILFYNLKTNLFIQADIDSSYISNLSAYDELIQTSDKLKKYFVPKNSDKVYKMDLYKELNLFLESENPLFILTGEAGSGKSTLLKIWTKSEDECKNIFVPYVGSNYISNSIDDDLLSTLIDDQEMPGFYNELMSVRNQNIVIIYDAINERKEDFMSIVNFFEQIRNLSKFLLDNNYFNIKIVISMRTDFYIRLKQYTNLDIPDATFYQSINSFKPEVCHSIPALDDKTIYALLSKKFVLTSEEMNIILKFLSKLHFDITPLIVDIVVENFKHNKLSSDSIFELEKNWIKNKLDIEDNKSEKEMNILYKLVEEKYFNKGYSNGSIKIQDILNLYPNEDYKVILTYIEKLNESGLITIFNTSISIKYDHSAELLLRELMLNKYNTEEIIKIISLNYNNPVVLTSFEYYFKHLLTYSSTLNIISFIKQMLDYYDSSVASSLYKLLIKISDDYESAEKVKLAIKTSYSILDKGVFEKFIQSIILEYKLICEHNEMAPEQLLKFLNPYISNNIRVLYEYVYSLFLFKISNNYYESYEHCLKADNNINELTLMSLKLEIKLLKASLLRYKGDLNEAVDILNALIIRQKELNQYDEYCKLTLQIGPILRELTEFEKAIEIYNSVPLELVNDGLLKNRLYMNKGIIIKNKLQILLENHSEENKYLKLYNDSLSLFSMAYNYSREYNNIPFRLEVLCEMIDISEIGYRLGLTNLSIGKTYVQEMKNIINKYPVPVRLIQAYRMEARITIFDENNLDYTINLLRKGKNIALKYNIPFRVADCCNQISSIVIDRLNNNLSKELIEEAISCTEYSINYYETLKNSNHKYLLHEYKKNDELVNYYHNNFDNN